MNKASLSLLLLTLAAAPACTKPDSPEVTPVEEARNKAVEIVSVQQRVAQKLGARLDVLSVRYPSAAGALAGYRNTLDKIVARLDGIAPQLGNAFRAKNEEDLARLGAIVKNEIEPALAQLDKDITAGEALAAASAPSADAGIAPVPAIVDAALPAITADAGAALATDDAAAPTATGDATAPTATADATAAAPAATGDASATAPTATTATAPTATGDAGATGGDR